MNFQNKKHEMTIALVLGAIALGASLILGLFNLNSYSLPHIFVYLAAMALGPSGALTTSAVYLLPSLITNQNGFEVLRLVTFGLGLGYASNYAPRIPGYYLSAAMWGLIFAPLYLWSGFLPVHSFVSSPLELLAYICGDISMAVLAGTLLMNSDVWAMLSTRPRHIDLTTFLNYFLASVLTLSVFTFVSLLAGLVGSAPFAPLVVLLLLAVTLPALTSPLIAHLLSENARGIFAGSILGANRSETFSGKSSTYLSRENTATTIARLSPSELKISNVDRNSEPDFSESGLANPEMGVCALNRNGTITFVSRRFRSLLGITANEVTGKNVAAIGLPQSVVTHLLKLLEDSFVHGPRKTELKLNQHPEKLRFFEFNSRQSDASQTSAISEGPDSMIISVREITDRRTVESELLEAQKLKYLGETIAGIAHAFNNSLTAITGHASVAKLGKDAREVRENLDRVLDAAIGAGDLVRKLIDFAEGKPGVMSTQDLRSLIVNKLELLRRMVGDQHEIEVEYGSDTLGACCDSHLLMQALANLVINAKEAYGPRGGKISISLEQEHIDEDVAYLHVGAQAGDYVRLRVRDFGLGMSRETMARAFDPLFTTKASSGHSGLGLSIVYAIVKSHDGFLTVESRPDKGTTVSIYIPRKPMEKIVRESDAANTTNAPAAPENFAELRGSEENILIVEDEPAIRDLIARMLTSLGYKVSSFANGQEAIQGAALNKIDLVLVDMIMPRMNGLEFISSVRKRGCTVPTLVMTGYGIESSVTEDGSTVIPKPFDLATLGRAIKNALAKTGSSAHASLNGAAGLQPSS